jgi:hypothetical protein
MAGLDSVARSDGQVQKQAQGEIALEDIHAAAGQTQLVGAGQCGHVADPAFVEPLKPLRELASQPSVPVGGVGGGSSEDVLPAADGGGVLAPVEVPGPCVAIGRTTWDSGGR